MSQMEKNLRARELSRRRVEEEEENKCKYNYKIYLIIIAVVLLAILIIDFFIEFEKINNLFIEEDYIKYDSEFGTNHDIQPCVIS